MAPNRYSGSLQLKEEGSEEEIFLGLSGDAGVHFKTNFYLKRNTEDDDYHDISLAGTLSTHRNTLITVHYLISNSFPVIYCFCHAGGPYSNAISKVRFPLGFHLMDDARNHLYLPQDLDALQKPDAPMGKEQMWQPARNEEHLVVGTPYFVLTQKHQDKAGACIGFLQHPFSMLEIRRSGTGRFVTPGSAKLEVTGITEEMPYMFRYQFFPTDDLEVINWLSREYLNSQPPRFFL
jgi:hypothetical protein